MKKDLSCGYVLGMSVFLFFVASGVGALGGVAISSVTKNDYNCVEWTVLICDAILIPFYLNFLKRSGLNTIDGEPIQKAIIHIVLGSIVVLLFNSAFTRALELAHISLNELNYWNNVSSNTTVLLSLVVGVILGPIFEELLFRGIIFGTVREKKAMVGH